VAAVSQSKRRCQSTKLRGVTFQKTEILKLSSARISCRKPFGSVPWFWFGSLPRPAIVLVNHLQYVASLQSVLNRKPTIVTRLHAQRSGFRVPSGAKNCSLLQRAQNDFGANSTSYLVGTEVFFSGVKRPEFEFNHSSSGLDEYPLQ